MDVVLVGAFCGSTASVLKRKRERTEIWRTGPQRPGLQQLTTAHKDAIEHGLGESAGEGVLLAWMKRRDQCPQWIESDFQPVAEGGTFSSFVGSRKGPSAVEGKPA